MNAFVFAVACALVACASTARAPGRGVGDDAESFVRVRCATDGSDVWVSWTGEVTAQRPGEAPVHLFDVAGASVARCLRDATGAWFMTSRELMYYLDPTTGLVAHRWENPWTGETVSVVHVANTPVQKRFRGGIPRAFDGEQTVYAVTIPVSYPNPLASDPRTKRFSPAATYRATESFSFRAPRAEVDDPRQSAVSHMTFTWERTGPWLPWMDMGARPGQLVYSATGKKLAGIEQLPPVIRDDLARLPLYRSAPTCWLDAPNETSWTYFAAHLDDYVAGARFPRPRGAEPPCAATRSRR